jgi:hypothetical protein
VRAAAIVSVFGDQALKMLDSREAVTKLQQVSRSSEKQKCTESATPIRRTACVLQNRSSEPDSIARSTVLIEGIR